MRVANDGGMRALEAVKKSAALCNISLWGCMSCLYVQQLHGQFASTLVALLIVQMQCSNE